MHHDALILRYQQDACPSEPPHTLVWLKLGAYQIRRGDETCEGERQMGGSPAQNRAAIQQQIKDGFKVLQKEGKNNCSENMQRFLLVA